MSSSSLKTNCRRLTFTTGNLGGNRIANHVMQVMEELNSTLDSEIDTYMKRLKVIESECIERSTSSGHTYKVKPSTSNELQYLTHLELANLHKLKGSLHKAIWEDYEAS